MTTANFFFHGLFPDYIEPNEGTGKQICKVLFDVEFAGKLHSHLIADLWPIDEGDDVPTYEVRYELPFNCDEFSKSVVQYYQLVVGPQATTISHSGPKGFNPKNNVFRVQWEIALEASKK